MSEIALHAKQSEAVRLLSNSGPVSVLGYGGAKGGGKSMLSRAWLVMRGSKYPGSRGVLIRRTYQELYRNHVVNFLKEYPWLTYVERRNSLEFPNGSVIELQHCECEADLERVQGVEYQSGVIDQAEQTSKALYTWLRSCMRSTVPGMATRIMLTFNPGGVGHSWLKRMFIERVPDENERLEDTAFIRAQVYDNPSLMQNDPEYLRHLETLPEQLRRAYLDGDFDSFEGQFFSLLPESVETPFQIPESIACQSLYGSLDHGISHATSFGLWYLGADGGIHRLFTYLHNGGTARDHAAEVRQRIEAFPFTMGHMPRTVWFDPSMNAKSRLSEQHYRAVIDEYKDVFSGTSVQFVEANNQKESGCAIMRQAFALDHGVPRFRYWKQYNHGLEDGLKAMVADANHPEMYTKQDGDDIVDECRYGLVGLWTVKADRARAEVMRSRSERYNRARNRMDWLVGV